MVGPGAARVVSGPAHGPECPRSVTSAPKPCPEAPGLPGRMEHGRECPRGTIQVAEPFARGNRPGARPLLGELEQQIVVLFGWNRPSVLSVTGDQGDSLGPEVFFDRRQVGGREHRAADAFAVAVEIGRDRAGARRRQELEDGVADLELGPDADGLGAFHPADDRRAGHDAQPLDRSVKVVDGHADPSKPVEVERVVFTPVRAGVQGATALGTQDRVPISVPQLPADAEARSGMGQEEPSDVVDDADIEVGAGLAGRFDVGHLVFDPDVVVAEAVQQPSLAPFAPPPRGEELEDHITDGDETGVGLVGLVGLPGDRQVELCIKKGAEVLDRVVVPVDDDVQMVDLGQLPLAHGGASSQMWPSRAGLPTSPCTGHRIGPPTSSGIRLGMPSEPRLSPLPEAEWDERQRAVLEPLLIGPTRNIYTTLVRAPELAERMTTLGRTLRAEGMSVRHRETLILRTGANCGSEYEFAEHRRLALQGGMTSQDIERIQEGPDAGGLGPLRADPLSPGRRVAHDQPDHRLDVGQPAGCIRRAADHPGRPLGGLLPPGLLRAQRPACAPRGGRGGFRPPSLTLGRSGAAPAGPAERALWTGTLSFGGASPVPDSVPAMDSTKVPLGVKSDPFDKFARSRQRDRLRPCQQRREPVVSERRSGAPPLRGRHRLDGLHEPPPLPPEATEGVRGGVHGEHDLYIKKPVVPGSWLHTVGERSGIVCSSAGMNVFAKLVTTDDDGDVVLEQYWSSLMRGIPSGGDQGTPPAEHNFPEASREHLVGSVSLPTTRDQTFRYAGASGDRAPMHVDDEVACSLGFPGKFNQGLCTLAVTSRGLIELAAGGDPRRVRRVAVRFSSPVFPGNSIDLSVYDAGPVAAGHAFSFEASSEGQVTLRHGLVEVAPDRSMAPGNTGRSGHTMRVCQTKETPCLSSA